MAMEKQILTLMRLVDGKAAPFPSADAPAVLGTYTYTAQRMAGAPSITATLMYPRCLDDEWTRGEFVEFGGERYYITQVPTSSKSNDSLFYKHELTLLSERSVLEETYFLDVVASNTEMQYRDRVRSNYTSFNFHGDIVEFVSRLNSSLIYSGLCTYDAAKKSYDGYHVVIDEGITSDTKDVSFDTKFLSEALQQIHETFELSYYFVGKTCHVGYQENAIPDELKYGADTGLLTIAKNNADYKIIDRITGVGSTDNIPYYYPNDSPEGKAVFEVTGIDASMVESIDLSKLRKYVDPYSKKLSWTQLSANVTAPTEAEYYPGSGDHLMFTYRVKGDKGVSVQFSPLFSAEADGRIDNLFANVVVDGKWYAVDKYFGSVFGISEKWSGIAVCDGTKDIAIVFHVYVYGDFTGKVRVKDWTMWETLPSLSERTGFAYDGGFIPYADSGIVVTDTSALGDGFSLTVTGRQYIAPSKNLMPSVYRETNGEQRFYNAENGKYKAEDDDEDDDANIKDGKGFYHYNNPFVAGRPHEGKQDFDDIKPSIKGVKNAEGKLYGELADVAYDENDNDLLGDGKGTSNDIFNGTDEYQHSWFYIRLNKFDGDETSFNLFDYAIESQSAYIEMTSGNCAGCKFEIGVIKKANGSLGRYDFYNPVQVKDDGSIVDGDFGKKVVKNNLQPAQQSTVKNSVWIAVKKDNSTYGVVLPNVTNNYKPHAGDTFVITGIKLPKPLVVAAEKRLDNALVKYMAENNDEKFTFAVTFSRIWLASHPGFTAKLNENARLNVSYNGHIHTLYVSSYTCKADGNILREISVELADTLTVSQSGLQKQMEAVKGDIIASISGTKQGDDVAKLTRHFIRKDTADEDPYSLTLSGGLTMNSDAKSRQFTEGMLGAGWQITRDGTAWLGNLSIRNSLVVPSITYNRTEVLLGDEWQAPGGGMIESATPDTDAKTGETLLTGTAKLHLEDGELGAIAPGDICMGYFHCVPPLQSHNAISDKDDSRGNMAHAGFSTIYFRIDEVSGESNENLRYTLRGNSERFTQTGLHPQPSLRFVSYGSFTDEGRQKSALRTRTYTRYLARVSTWEFTADNIEMQLGDLSNLSVHGLGDLKGYSAYLNNVYMRGTIEKLDSYPARMEITYDGYAELAEGETGRVTCRVWRGWEDITEQVTRWGVTRETASAGDDAVWSGDHKDFAGTLDITTRDLAPSGQRTLFTFTAEGGKGTAIESPVSASLEIS